ncbi:hypothetical protein C5167_029481 [Papaver somniferum]|uniref:uncharacterized protein LOC113344843 n=1 Tax=Papaver somniferum TaxID=3469 RepID=UPI000E701997|nr:uncharacterized protein LOC113344843 [Papaver somniferum]RZC93838.1 hypothetical protein C5167_029481 [Papaver somniferum]
MKGSKDLALTFADKCKNIMASNWRGYLNTVKADAAGSKEDIHTSRIMYFLKRGIPYLCVPQDDLHNLNVVIDERGSMAVANPYPGPLANVLKSIGKLPTRVALTGDVLSLEEEKMRHVTESLRETIELEKKVISAASYAVKEIFNSSRISSVSRTDNLRDVLSAGENGFVVYKFDIRSCSYIDSTGTDHEVDLEELELSKTDPLSMFAEKLIDGINQNRARRSALMLFCFEYLEINAADAYMISADSKGFDVLAKIPSNTTEDDLDVYTWRECRIDFKEEACDIGTFCRLLVEMEAEALQNLRSGLQAS